MAELRESLIIAKPTHEGYSWTLPSRLSHMLRTAEEVYGRRDLSYTILGVEFSEAGPQVWYPGNCNHIVIQLGIECLNEPHQAFFQLAHECIHLLSPSGNRNATALEEGLATHFSITYMYETFQACWYPSMMSYKKACNAVEELLAVDSNAIKQLRQQQSKISSITEDEILAAYPSIKLETAQYLSQAFDRESIA